MGEKRRKNLERYIKGLIHNLDNYRTGDRPKYELEMELEECETELKALGKQLKISYIKL